MPFVPGPRCALAAMFFIVSLLVFCLVATAALAQTCLPHDLAVVRLAERYGETPVVMGVTASGELMEVFGSEETGTWTVIVTSPTGISCIVDAGGDLVLLPDAGKPGDPT